jgi:aspartate aminotransferase
VLETSQRTRGVSKALESLSSFFTDSSWARRHKEPDVCDFAFGNPQEWPLPQLVEALRFHAMPRNKDWFAYKANEPETCVVIAEALGKKLGLPFEAEDIAVTNGAFAALVVAIHLLADPGDEVVFSIPPWFCYETLIINAGAVPIKVPVIVSAFDLDLDAIAGAITPRTRIVIVNSPHNPTGRVYSSEVLARLAAILEAASTRHGRANKRRFKGVEAASWPSARISAARASRSDRRRSSGRHCPPCWTPMTAECGYGCSAVTSLSTTTE